MGKENKDVKPSSRILQEWHEECEEKEKDKT